MQKYRNQIDVIDKNIVLLLSKRMKIAKEIAKYKKKNNMPIYDKKREQQVLFEKLKLANKYKLNQNFIRDLFKRIMKESKTQQEKIVK